MTGPASSSVRLHKTVGVRVGHLQVGGGAPIAVQSMTMTETADAEATARQCIELAEAAQDPILAARRVLARDAHRGEQLLGDADLALAMHARESGAPPELPAIGRARQDARTILRDDDRGDEEKAAIKMKVL